MQSSSTCSRSWTTWLDARAGMLAAAVLAVLTAGVVSSLALSTDRAAARATEPAAQVVYVAAYEVAPAPVDVELRVPPAPVPPAPPPSVVSAQSSVPSPLPSPVPAKRPRQAAAPAADDPLCTGAGWQGRRGQRALESLRAPNDASSFAVTFEAGRSGVIGLATVHERRLQVFVRPCGQLSTGLLRHVIAHELGHLVDGARLDDGQRGQWLAARGIPADTAWYGCNSCTDFATPAGDYAEVYAQWQTGAATNRSELAGTPSPAELDMLAATFF